MTKYTRRPLTTATWCDLFTGEFVWSQLSFSIEEKQKEMKKNFDKKEKNEKWEVFVEWLGRVK